MELAHDTPLAGHLGVRKTCQKVIQHLYWPRLKSDVAQCCRSIIFGSPTNVKNLTKAFTMVGVFIFRNGIVSGKRVKVHRIGMMEFICCYLLAETMIKNSLVLVLLS
jgi:hypothetical protein